MKFTTLTLGALAIASASAFTLSGAYKFAKDLAKDDSSTAPTSSVNNQSSSSQSIKAPQSPQAPTSSAPSNTQDSSTTSGDEDEICAFVKEILKNNPEFSTFLTSIIGNKKREVGSGPVLPPSNYRPSHRGRYQKSSLSSKYQKFLTGRSKHVLRNYAKKLISEKL